MTSRKLTCINCKLTRSKGGAIVGRTVDLSDAGMQISTDRPLAIDEVLNVDIIFEGGERHGTARVLRQTGYDTYALRFEEAG